MVINSFFCKYCKNCECCLLSLFIEGLQWMLRSLFSIVRYAMSPSMVKSLLDCSLGLRFHFCYCPSLSQWSNVSKEAKKIPLCSSIHIPAVRPSLSSKEVSAPAWKSQQLNTRSLTLQTGHHNPPAINGRVTFVTVNCQHCLSIIMMISWRRRLTAHNNIDMPGKKL